MRPIPAPVVEVAPVVEAPPPVDVARPVEAPVGSTCCRQRRPRGQNLRWR